ncbi:hypothetical protein [Streptomyces sp. NPDC054765]
MKRQGRSRAARPAAHSAVSTSLALHSDRGLRELVDCPLTASEPTDVKITHDADMCCAAGRCVLIAPEVPATVTEAGA